MFGIVQSAQTIDACRPLVEVAGQENGTELVHKAIELACSMLRMCILSYNCTDPGYGLQVFYNFNHNIESFQDPAQPSCLL